MKTHQQIKTRLDQKSESNKPTTVAFKTYYAVGSPIDLFKKESYRGLNDQYCSRDVPVSEFSGKTILDSLRSKESVLLFNDYEYAQRYVSDMDVKIRMGNDEQFVVVASRAIFVVQMRESLYRMQPIEGMAMHCEAFTKNMEKISFSKFEGRIFHYSAKQKQEFAKIWGDNSSLKSAIAGLTRLFNSYSSGLLTSITRNHHPEVQSIIRDVSKARDIPALHKLIEGTLTEVSKNTDINQTGHYARMLRFANTQLQALNQMNELPGMKDYLRNVNRP